MNPTIMQCVLVNTRTGTHRLWLKFRTGGVATLVEAYEQRYGEAPDRIEASIAMPPLTVTKPQWDRLWRQAKREGVLRRGQPLPDRRT